MRHASMRRHRLLPLLAAATLLAACQQAAPPAGPGGQPYAYTIGRGSGRVALTPRFVQAQASAAARRLQAFVATRTVGDIQHVGVKFVRVVFDADGITELSEVPQGEIDLAASEIFNTVVVGDLANDTTYRFRATAYASAGIGEPISVAADSFVDLVIGNDDRVVAGELKVRLADVPFNGRASSAGLAVQDGGFATTVGTAVHVTATLGVATVAGDGVPGFINSAVEDPLGRLNSPQGLAADGEGNVFIADPANHAIRRLGLDGRLTGVSGGGGFAATNGTLADAMFNGPSDVAVGSGRKLFVADSGNGMIRVIDPDADTVTTLISGLAFPRGVAEAPNGHVWVANSGENAVCEYDAAGTLLRTFGQGAGTPGFTDGGTASATFSQPWGVVCAADGTVYVADRQNHAIRRITLAGQVETYKGDGSPGSGNGDGEGVGPQYYLPTDLALDDDGTLYIGDSYNNLVRKVDPNGIPHTVAGSIEGFLDSAFLNSAQFNLPTGVAVDRNGVVYVGDTANHRVRRIQSKGRLPA